MQQLYAVADVLQGLARTRLEPSRAEYDWALSMVESGDIRDDGWFTAEGLREVSVPSRLLVERHTLRPYDVLLTARTSELKVALVPPSITRVVAGITILVVRPDEPELGFGHWIWYYLTSAPGREQLTRRFTVNATTTSLSARSVSEIEIPIPSRRQLDDVARFVEASETAYTEAIAAARIRRETLRDAIINDIMYRSDESA